MSKAVIAALAGLSCSLVAASTGVAYTQDQITALAQAQWQTRAAAVNWDQYYDLYLNGDATWDQYEAGALAWLDFNRVQSRLIWYQASGDVQYLEQVLDRGTQNNAHRADRLNPAIWDDSRLQFTPAWASWRYSTDSPGPLTHFWIVHAGQITVSPVKAAAIVKQDPALDAVYGAQADAIIADAVQTIDAFDAEFVDLGGQGLYTDPYYQASRPWTGGHLPYNQQNSPASTMIALYHATGDTRWHDRAEALAQRMKNELTISGDHYVWRYADFDPVGSDEDISHAAINVDFMIDAYEAGIVFDDDDMARLANTLRNAYLGPTQGFADYVDGSVLDGRYATSGLRWMRLARYDPALRTEFADYAANIWAAHSSGSNTALASTAMFAETGQGLEAEQQVEDGFDAAQMDYRWRRADTQSIGVDWQRATGPAGLTVTDIDEPGNTGWQQVLRKREVEGGDIWEAMASLAWDSVGGLGELNAMQRALLEVYDENGDVIASVGIRDAWFTRTGSRDVDLGTASDQTGMDSLAAAGSADIRITADPGSGIMRVFWDGVEILSVNEHARAKAVGLNISGHGYSQAHFGTITFGELSLYATDLPGDVTLDGVVDSADFNILASNFNTLVGGTLKQGDLTGDGVIDSADFNVLAGNFNTAAPAPPMPSAIPEPALGLSLFLLLLINRR